MLLAVTIHVCAAGPPQNAACSAWISALIDGRQLAPVLMALVVVPILIAAAAVAVALTPLTYDAYKAWAPDTFPLLHSAVDALLPLLALAVISSLEVAVFLALRHRNALLHAGALGMGSVAPALLVLLIVLATVFHWLVLIFQLRFFVNLPAWYWIFDPVPFTPGDLWFALGALILLGLAYWLLIIKHRLALGLLAAAALGLFLQFGPGLMGGRGLDTLRDRYFTTYHEAYVRAASESDLGLLDTVRRYEEAYGSGSFTGTKPPGLMVFYTALDHLANGYPSSLDDAARYQRLSDLVVWLFPLLAVSMVAAHLRLRTPLPRRSNRPRAARSLRCSMSSRPASPSSPSSPIRPCILRSFCSASGSQSSPSAGTRWSGPSCLARCSTWVRSSPSRCSPCTSSPALYLLLHHWREPSGRRLQQIILCGLAIAAGTLLMHFLARGLLNYDFLPRFERTMSINHNFDFYLRVGQQPPAGPEPLGVRLGQILSAAWINNLDFAAAIGFPIYILFLAQAVRRVPGASSRGRPLTVMSSSSPCCSASSSSTLPAPRRERCRACGCSGCRWSCCWPPMSSNRTSASGRTSCWRLALPSWSH